MLAGNHSLFGRKVGSQRCEWVEGILNSVWGQHTPLVWKENALRSKLTFIQTKGNLYKKTKNSAISDHKAVGW